MTRRTRARTVAFQVLYQDDLNLRVSPSVGEDFVRQRLRSAALAEFARQLIGGVRMRRGELDSAIQEAADNWSLQRMAVTDRNVLRLGAYEILYLDTPDHVAIDEAVELAKRFGTALSGQFVNGVLDRLMRSKPEAASEEPGAASGD
jgi:N utilization substance protein B